MTVSCEFAASTGIARGLDEIILWRPQNGWSPGAAHLLNQNPRLLCRLMQGTGWPLL
jgi:hypothetical protein